MHKPFQHLIPAELVQRYKRFLADVRLQDGTLVTAHCANSGSMLGLSNPGMQVFIEDVKSPTRKLDYSLEMVHNGSWIGVNTQRPNEIVKWLIEEGKFPGIPKTTPIRREVKYGENSRIDLLLGENHYVEVKNCTLFEDDYALFPDAVSARGAKHMRELTEVVNAGGEATVAFVVNGGKATKFDSCREIDPTYAQALDAAVKVGVKVVALKFTCGPNGYDFEGTIPFVPREFN